MIFLKYLDFFNMTKDYFIAYLIFISLAFLPRHSNCSHGLIKIIFIIISFNYLWGGGHEAVVHVETIALMQGKILKRVILNGLLSRIGPQIFRLG